MEHVIIAGTAANSAQVENTNNTADNTNKTAKNDKKKVTRKPVSNCDQILVYARRKFFALPKEMQDITLKRKFIIAAMNNLRISEKEFYGEFNLHLSVLLESIKFVRDCRDRGLCPFVVAQHVIFAGMSYSIDILRKGLDVVFPNLYSVDMQKEDAIIEYSTLKQYDGNRRLLAALSAQGIECGVDEALPKQLPAA